MNLSMGGGVSTKHFDRKFLIMSGIVQEALFRPNL